MTELPANHSSSNMHSLDCLFINSIIKNNIILPPNDSYNISEIIKPTSIGPYIKSLEFIINRIDNKLYKTTKYKLTCLLARCFGFFDTVEKHFSVNFIYDNIDYFIEENFFYSKFLKPMLVNKQYIEYFKFIPCERHIDYYVSLTKKMIISLDNIVSFTNSSQYSILKTSDYLVYVNYISLMYDYAEYLTIGDRDKLFSNIELLIINTLTYIYNNILTNKDHLKLYTLINTSKHITANEIDLQRTYLTRDMTIYINWIRQILDNSLFINHLILKYESFDIIDTPGNSIVSLSYIITQNWFDDISTSKTLLILSDKILLNHLDKMYTCGKMNVHILSKLITDSNNQTFYNKQSISDIILFYNKLESYGDNTGFYEKTVTRDHIVYILTDYITKSHRNKIIRLEGECDVRDTELSDISAQLNINNIIKTMDTNQIIKFVVLLISDFSEILNSVDIDIAFSDGVLNMYKTCYSIAKIPDYYCVITQIIKIIDINEIVTAKTCEMIHGIFDTFFNKRIFRDIYELKHSGIGLDFTSDILSTHIERFIINFYKDIDTLFSKTIYRDYFASHEEIYNKHDIENTVALIGFLEIHKGTTIESITTKYITGLDIHIYDYSKIIDKYSEEIPGEFIDPIYYSPISFPLELPGTKTIVDKNVIMNHLFFKSTNPFNGLKLTRDELLEYNTDKEVIIRLDEFVINFNTWKISHKIYSY